MKIAVLGAGKIGGTLGKKWTKAGHSVRFGVRDVHKPQLQELLQSAGANASASSVPEAIDFGEVILFAIPGTMMSETIAANAAALDGKTIIDSANRVAEPIVNSYAMFAAHTPKANVYRAFSTLGWENFENPTFGDVPADLFYCGPDGAPRPAIEALITAVGLRPIYVGGTDHGEVVDGLFKLWFSLVRGQKMSRAMAFKLLTRE